MLCAAPAVAQKAVMEGVNASRFTIKVDTTNGRVDIATTSYNWAIPNVGLHVASNVVVDSTNTHNACVIYATGSVSCLGVTLGATPGISTGVVTTAALTGTGSSSSPLGVSFSSVPSLGQANAFTGNNTYAGSETFSSTVALAPGGEIVLNPSGGNTLNNSGGFAVYATSIDGASESSGCAVVVNMNGTTGAVNEAFQFTSTTTASIVLASTQKIPGVLLQTCAPGASCLVGIAGIYRVFASNAVSNQLGTSGTRCQVASNASFTDSLFGYSLETNSGASAIWVKLDK